MKQYKLKAMSSAVKKSSKHEAEQSGDDVNKERERYRTLTGVAGHLGSGPGDGPQ